ncbi:alpha/beta fold hydrolase [Parabacteroides sp. 52]|uniref:alpha/beta hydrolase n=1 Tax=unclassified Parabacteroides TaxID=2649774 RepID=UPI0013D20D81|nr:MULTISPECIES: lipase family protein [unclassified Parabacteroides]MDH6534836.1 pimeloyl-ACP methyl ester carboxylesterase [Parabacteroides sp. PM5-20]NDV55555.1 alpha/beta fold hydrolase [Parabacteroides sp. 52]
MKKEKNPCIYYLFFFLLLNGFFACSHGDEKEIPDPTDANYFIAVTESVSLDRTSLLKRLSSDVPDFIALLLPDTKIQTDAIRYKSKDPKGNPVEASGIISYPTKGPIKGVVVGEHYSIGANREAPSSTMAIIESALALFGYVVIAPDYLGFGSTVDLPQTYLHAESAGRVSVDIFFAAREYMEKRNTPIGKEIDIIGYSQGGYSALAFAQMAEEHYAEEISIRRVFAGGGPYVPASMFDLFIESNTLDNPPTVLLATIGLDYGDQLNLNYANVFQEPLLSNYTDWCISKKYSLAEIEKKLGSKKLSDFMHPDLFQPNKNADLNKLYTSLHRNNVIGWTPQAFLLLVHGKKDQTVPHINAEKAYESFQNKGCQVELKSFETDHSDTAIPFFLEVLNRLGT